MSGSGNPVGDGVQATDDGRGTVLPGEAAGESTVFRVQGGYGVGVAGIIPTDTERGGNGR